jgi:broad specificity phosphatase PhoE
MARITLVRHGRAAAGFGDDADPGLHPEGVIQAEAVADLLAPGGPMPVVVSPLRRTAETAAPLAARWSVEVRVDARVAEIPSPTDDLPARAAWLAGALQGSWADLGPRYARWRDEVVDAVVSLDEDAVVYTHFVAINAVVGAAERDDRLVVFAPGYCSRTVVDVDVRTRDLRVVARGAQAETEVR